MKLKHKVLAYSMIPALLGVGILGMNAASAHGLYGGFFGSALTPEQIVLEQQNMFDNEAQILGISVDEVKNAWAQGKTMLQLAQEKGITEEQLQIKIKDARAARLKIQLQTLVDKGVITQAQADQRLSYMQNQQTNNAKGRAGGRRHGGGGMMGY
jgi:hypothetical protein